MKYYLKTIKFCFGRWYLIWWKCLLYSMYNVLEVLLTRFCVKIYFFTSGCILHVKGAKFWSRAWLIYCRNLFTQGKILMNWINRNICVIWFIIADDHVWGKVTLPSRFTFGIHCFSVGFRSIDWKTELEVVLRPCIPSFDQTAFCILGVNLLPLLYFL